MRQSVFLPILFLFAASGSAFTADSKIDLSGQWRFALDAKNKGLAERWYEKDLTGDAITLPATTDIAKKGTPNNEKLEDKLTRRYKFIGKAWYQRDITIPDDRKEQPLVLTLERTRHTTVWLDSTKLPDPHQSLSAPHRYSLPKVSGKCRLTILVDNDPKLFPASGHMINEDIQTNWNGIIGEISLKTASPQKTTSEGNNANAGGKARLTRDGRQLLCDGVPFFLRGKCDSMEFPLTGAPPMDKDFWLKYLTLCKSYGINHHRFHSCCPPEAAFAAADELGILFQVEGTMMWGRFHRQYQTAEAKAILDEYGNHPSFVIFSLGNEIGGDTRSELGEVIDLLRQYDGNRRMFLTGTNNWAGNPMQHPADDVWVTMWVKKTAAGIVRASESNIRFGHIENGPPNTRHDYTEALQFSTVPIIAHEIGQYQVFPNFDDIEKLTGVLEGRNLQIFKDRLEKAGMFERWKDFYRASLETAILCYKEDIEAALRTASFGGFQILDLQDYQSYGPALVGIFNVLMEPKAPDLQKRWTQFCNDIVPLALFDKYVWEADEKFSAEVKVANYGSPTVQATCLIECDGKSIAPDIELPKGKLTTVPVSFGMTFGEVKKPKKLTLSVSLSGGQNKKIAKNTWNIWVYPKYTGEELQKLSEGICITASNDEASAALEKGQSVLLLNGSKDKTAGNKQGAVRIPGMFTTDFWNWAYFGKRSPGTLGLLCDPQHPVFADFPTDFHTNWNWWHLIKNSNNAVLDDFPKDFEPLVQMIDNVSRNHKIGMIFECRAGSGKLLVCCIDEQTLRTRPEGRQLLVSMLNYMQSQKFKPAAVIAKERFQSF
ncbi:MAG: hypothetical protein LBT89_06355 [Planctomycetaceae bacterium]|jgi:hypothetical protein|nr:hypothetical protein [Planctomycetaceae bacterium]